MRKVREYQMLKLAERDAQESIFTKIIICMHGASKSSGGSDLERVVLSFAFGEFDK